MDKTIKMNTPEEMAKKWADEMYTKNSYILCGEYCEDDLWENRYNNYLDGYKAGQASKPEPPTNS